MSAQVTPISGCGAKGPACFLVETGDARILLDLGYGPQPGLWPDVSHVGAVDALLLSHSHNDHAGGLKLLPQVGTPRVYATDIVRRLLPPHIEAATLPLQGTREVCAIAVTTGRNGHAPGGVWLHLDVGGGLLYMGDFCVDSTLYAYDEPPPAATVILDASYGTYDVAREDALSAFEEVWAGGAALLPVPAAGRGPEIALHLALTGRDPARLDDAVRASIASLVAENAACVRDGVLADLRKLAEHAPAIQGPEGVMLAASADGTSGESAKLLATWQTAGPAIIFTGYLPPGTPASTLAGSGRARYLRWPVHPGLADNARLVRSTSAQRVLPAFGDASHLKAWQEAFSPARVVLKGPVAL
jgi:glyoxylase-like metal-dependent hydrolase (beta-lactamase superfamily II)